MQAKASGGTNAVVMLFLSSCAGVGEEAQLKLSLC